MAKKKPASHGAIVRRAARRFVIDSSVLMNFGTLFPVNVMPQFWELLDARIHNDVVIAPIEVWEEIDAGTDFLCSWLKQGGRKSAMFKKATEDVIKAQGEIVSLYNPDYVAVQPEPWADPWVVALAEDTGRILVCDERNTSQKVPRIASQRNVEYIKRYEFMSRAGITWGDPS